ncbi:MAG TPA: ABC transporter permease [Candidatus Dormibacteraeota bacterium]|jgi:macrolide transport system ATP-binding/permease protein|nr:ABC transporter permease [Candidatus Dormibacteraeota bacterium]
MATRQQFENDATTREKNGETSEFRFESVLQDFRFAIRQLRNNPGFALTAIIILALGICASVSIFGFVDAALLKPVPYQDATQLVGFFGRIALGPQYNVSYLDYLDFKKDNKVFSSMNVYQGDDFLLTTPVGAQKVDGARVSDGFFRTLGVTPVLGRDFLPGEDLPGASRTVILSYVTWQKRFGGNRAVLGKSVILDGEQGTVIGVLPKGFHFALVGPAEFWTPLHSSGNCEQRRVCHNLKGIARLRDGVSVQTALANMTSIAQQLELQYPDSNRGQGAFVMPLSDAIVGDVRPILLVLLSGTGLLMIMACVNVSSLLLVRSETRKREIAIRGALGASYFRLICQFVTEGLLLVGASAVIGVGCAYLTMRLLARLIPREMLDRMPYVDGLGLNLHVLEFACCIILVAGLLFAVTPMFRLSLWDIRVGLTAGSRGSAGTVWRRLGSNLVVIELATATVLLVGAGLLGKSFYRLLHVDTGIKPDHLATLQVDALESGYSQEDQKIEFERQIVSRIARLPGVKSVGISTSLPVNGNGPFIWFQVVGQPDRDEHNEVNQRQISSDYLATLQARLLSGRYFSDTEDSTKPRVAIINQALAKQYFPGESPIGKQIRYSKSQRPPMEIVGMVEDIKEGPLEEATWPTIYIPFEQNPTRSFSVAVRTSQAEQATLPMLAAAIHQIGPGIAISGESTMSTNIRDSESAYLHRSSAWLVAGFAAMALLLGVIGLYGVVEYSVSQRTREIGVRMALGAQRNSVYQLILKEAGRLIGAGIALGLVCSMAAAALIRNLLFGISSWDAPTLVAVAVVLGIAALSASYIPARRASSVNPIEALRAE